MNTVIAISKSLTVMTELGNGKTAVSTKKLTQFESVISGLSCVSISAYTSQAKAKKYIDMVLSMGFAVKETIWDNNEFATLENGNTVSTRSFKISFSK